MSGLRVVVKDLNYTPYHDFFPNINYLEYVKCRVLIIHGTNDA